MLQSARYSICEREGMLIVAYSEAKPGVRSLLLTFSVESFSTLEYMDCSSIVFTMGASCPPCPIEARIFLRGLLPSFAELLRRLWDFDGLPAAATASSAAASMADRFVPSILFRLRDAPPTPASRLDSRRTEADSLGRDIFYGLSAIDGPSSSLPESSALGSNGPRDDMARLFRPRALPDGIVLNVHVKASPTARRKNLNFRIKSPYHSIQPRKH